MARIYDPYLNPLQLVEVNRTRLPQYVSRFMDDYWLAERLSSWQQLPDGPYYQPWLPSDNIALQFQNNAGQLKGTVINCQQTLQIPFILDQKQQNKYMPDYFIYEMSAALNVLPVGQHYFMVIEVGDTDVVLLGEGFDLQTEQPDTLLIEYTNRSFYGNAVFETGFAPSLRLRGTLQLEDPVSKDTLYEDQVLDMVMVLSKPYRLWELTLINIPDWMVDKLNWILGCSNLRIDGRFYTKNEGAKLTSQDALGNGTLKTYKIELREQLLRNSKIIDTASNTNEALSIMLNSTSKGFADTSTDASSSVVQFLDVE